MTGAIMQNGTLSVAFIGAGKMATAIAAGLNQCGGAYSCCAYDISPAAGKAFTAASGYPVRENMGDALRDAAVVILAVKPQFAAEALQEAAQHLDGKLLISIAAGLTIETLQKDSGTARVIRVMPNTPALAGEGMSCFAPAEGVGADDIAAAEKILAAVGRVRQVQEKQLDAVTGLSGSGPAYVMEFIMGLADGGVFCGLPRDMALELAIQTVLGTAAMCRENPAAIASLRDAVISPAGTTAEGILTLQEHAFKAASAKAVIAAAKRSAELGKK